MKRFLISILIILCLPLYAFSFNERESELFKVWHKWEGIYVVRIDGNKVKNRLHPVVSYMTPTELMNSGKYALIVNGGFFDMKTGDPVSYVTIDGEEVESPYNNENLMKNLEGQKRLAEVLNRSELRILKDNDNNKIKFTIQKHSEPIPAGYTLKHSIQGGPSILPKCTMEEESFIKYDKQGRILFESASVLKKRPRTLVGLDNKNRLYIVIYTRGHKTTIPDTEKFLRKKLKLKSAMGFDGGGSTALLYQDVKIVSEGEDGRAVKSFLVIEE